MGRSGVPTSSAGGGGRDEPGRSPGAWSQSKPSSVYPSPGWILRRPTFRSVSLSGANASVPATFTPRITASDLTSYSTRWPSRISTRAPAPGIAPPSQVAAADHGPLLAERTTGSAAGAGATADASQTAERKAKRTGSSLRGGKAGSGVRGRRGSPDPVGGNRTESGVKLFRGAAVRK